MFFLGLELDGFLGLIKSHNEVAFQLFHRNATRSITSEELTTLFEYNFMKFEGSEGNANQEMHEKAMAQAWKLLLKSIPCKSYPILSKTVFLMGCIAHVIFNIYKIVLQYGHLIPYTNQRDLRADFMPRHAIAVRPSGCQYTRASRASKDARLARVY